MKISCVIVEDEPMARKLLEQYVAKTPSLELMAALSSSLEALAFLQENKPDLLFLDVQMPELTGIGLLKIMQHKPYVVLTTAYSEYAIESFELDVADYLLKPITFERFLQSVRKITDRIIALGNTPSPKSSTDAATPEKSDFLFVKDGTKSVRINFADIQFIEGMKDYVRIHTPERKVTTLQSLKYLVKALPATDFIRVHHSYIVGVNWIQEVQRDDVMVGGNLIPVSDTYRGGVKEFIAGRELK